MAPYLVDASPYIFRAYFAPGPDREHKAVYGFAAFLLRLINEEEPSHLAIAFDESLTTSFRNDFYPEYKANRPLPPPEIVDELKTCQEMAAALGAATFCSERYEADDLIASLCATLPAGGKAIIVTNDKDLAQLVTETVTLLDFAKGVRYGPQDVVAKFGVRPDQITDLLALAGDSVDNIPGVRGVGPKSAVALLAAFRHIEDLYERLDEVEAMGIRGAKSLRKKLETHRDLAFLSKRLATVAADAPLPPHDLTYRGADRAKTEALFDKLGFDMTSRSRQWG